MILVPIFILCASAGYGLNLVLRGHLRPGVAYLALAATGLAVVLW